ncbi:MAG: hypothetical protein ACR2IK_04255 [Chloroflexota bacterium]
MTASFASARLDDGLRARYAHGHQGRLRLLDETVGRQAGMADAQFLDVAPASHDAVGTHVAVEERLQPEHGLADFAVPGNEPTKVRLSIDFNGPVLVDEEHEHRDGRSARSFLVNRLLMPANAPNTDKRANGAV